MKAATFGAWQTLCANAGKEAPTWTKYSKAFGVADESQVSATKESLKKEADIAMENVENIVKKVKKHGRR